MNERKPNLNKDQQQLYDYAHREANRCRTLVEVMEEQSKRLKIISNLLLWILIILILSAVLLFGLAGVILEMSNKIPHPRLW